jgi:putative heme-binding domain-containing protein
VASEFVARHSVADSRDGVASHKDSRDGVASYKWHHASRTECILCHTTRVGTIHGFRLPQLGNEADRLDALGLFAEPLPRKRDTIPDPHDESQPLEARARAYLHVNCGHCHSRGGGGSSFFDVRWTIPTTQARLFLRPTQGTFGITAAVIVAPGDPYRSVLYYRMCKLGSGHMPQFGAQTIDPRGTRLIHDWIASLPAAGPVTPPPLAPTLEQLLSTTSSALQLLTNLDAKMLPPDKAREAIARGAAHPDAAIRDLFERFVPEEKRVKRLGSAVKPEAILSLAGSASRGRDLFQSTSGVQCKNCHRIGQEGKQLGPDLTQIGKKLDRQKLLESILEPSKTVEPQYVSYLAEANGQALTGLVVQRDPLAVVLRQADGKEVRLATSEIDRLAPTAKSLMPELLVQDMTAQQVADLLEYLSGLR